LPMPAGAAELSAFREQEMEFEADRLAGQYLAPGALVGQVAPPIYFSILAMMEAMVPPRDAAVRTLSRVHPPSAARAERLDRGATPPGNLEQWDVLCAMPRFLRAVHRSEPFRATARAFSAALSTMPR